MLRLRNVAIATAIASLAACGGSSSVAITDLGSSLLDAQCQHYVDCGVVESVAVCKDLLRNFFNTAAIEGGITAGKIKYDGGKAGECIDAFAGASCNPGDQGNRTTPQACLDAIKGTIADGGACANDNECISQSCNNPTCSMACCPGTCDATQTKAAIGAACNPGACVDGAFCKAAATGTGSTCTALVAAGAACNVDDECAFGTVCLGATGATTCVKPAAKGAACIADGDGFSCGTQGLDCNQVTMKCEGRLFTGATCDPQNDRCATYLSCDSTSMKCVGAPAIGQPCVSGCASGAYCKPDASGTTSTCTAKQANGATCASGTECTSGHCDTASMKCADVAACF